MKRLSALAAAVVALAFVTVCLWVLWPSDRTDWSGYLKRKMKFKGPSTFDEWKAMVALQAFDLPRERKLARQQLHLLQQPEGELFAEVLPISWRCKWSLLHKVAYRTDAEQDAFRGLLLSLELVKRWGDYAAADAVMDRTAGLLGFKWGSFTHLLLRARKVLGPEWDERQSHPRLCAEEWSILRYMWDEDPISVWSGIWNLENDYEWIDLMDDLYEYSIEAYPKYLGGHLEVARWRGLKRELLLWAFPVDSDPLRSTFKWSHGFRIGSLNSTAVWRLKVTIKESEKGASSPGCLEVAVTPDMVLEARFALAVHVGWTLGDERGKPVAEGTEDPSSPTCRLDTFSDGEIAYTGCTCLPFPPKPKGASLPAKGELVLSVGIYKCGIEGNSWPVTDITLAPNKYYQVAPPGFLQRWGLPPGSPGFVYPKLLASRIIHRQNLLSRSRPREQRTFALPRDKPGLPDNSRGWFAGGEEQGGSGGASDVEPSTLDDVGSWQEQDTDPEECEISSFEEVLEGEVAGESHKSQAREGPAKLKPSKGSSKVSFEASSSVMEDVEPAVLEKAPAPSMYDFLADDYLADSEEPSLSYFLAVWLLVPLGLLFCVFAIFDMGPLVERGWLRRLLGWLLYSTARVHWWLLIVYPLGGGNEAAARERLVDGTAAGLVGLQKAWGQAAGALPALRRRFAGARDALLPAKPHAEQPAGGQRHTAQQQGRVGSRGGATRRKGKGGGGHANARPGRLQVAHDAGAAGLDQGESSGQAAAAARQKAKGAKDQGQSPGPSQLQTTREAVLIAKAATGAAAGAEAAAGTGAAAAPASPHAPSMPAAAAVPSGEQAVATATAEEPPVEEQPGVGPSAAAVAVAVLPTPELAAQVPAAPAVEPEPVTEGSTGAEPTWEEPTVPAVPAAAGTPTAAACAPIAVASVPPPATQLSDASSSAAAGSAEGSAPPRPQPTTAQVQQAALPKPAKPAKPAAPRQQRKQAQRRAGHGNGAETQPAVVDSQPNSSGAALLALLQSGAAQGGRQVAPSPAAAPALALSTADNAGPLRASNPRIPEQQPQQQQQGRQQCEQVQKPLSRVIPMPIPLGPHPSRPRYNPDLFPQPPTQPPVQPPAEHPAQTPIQLPMQPPAQQLLASAGAASVQAAPQWHRGTAPTGSEAAAGSNGHTQGQGQGQELEPSSSECILCWDSARETTLAPCGHRCLCLPCTRALLRCRGSGGEPPLCPICRMEVESFILRAFDV